MDSERPLQLGKYRMIAQLGQGGAASVYLAVASGPAGVNKLLVVKVLRRELADDPDVVQMFLDEARLSTRLSHPNIVQMLEVGRDGDSYFIVMEYLEGKPLNALFGNRVPGIGPDVLIHLMAESLAGLHYAHELTDYDGTPLGVVHRDVSPPNVFITYDGQAKLLDFGVAKTLNSSTHTEFGVIKGKPRYMAPEHALGQPLDRRADVFSAGVMLWEIATGQRLWSGKHDMAVLYAVSNGQIPKVRDAAPGLAPELARIITRALAPAKEERYPTAQALQEDLEAYLKSTGEVIVPRTIGRQMSERFAADRQQLRTAIDGQLRAMASLSTQFRVVSLPGMEQGSAANRSPESSPPPTTETLPRSVVRMSDSETSFPVAQSRGGGGVRVIGGALLAFVIAGGVGWAAFRQHPPSQAFMPVATALPTGAAAPSPLPPAPLPSAPNAPTAVTSASGSTVFGTTQPNTSSPSSQTVHVTIRAWPADARVTLDGKSIDANPFTGRLPKDDSPHVLHAAAHGYTSVDRTIYLVRDGVFELTLLKRGAHGSASPGPEPIPSPATTPAAPPTLEPSTEPAAPPPPPAPTTPSKRHNVDRTDPYAE